MTDTATLNFDSLRPVPNHWDPVFFHAKRKPSAVLILFLKETNSECPKVVFIRRSSKVGSHKGQIGFPGGRLEAGDGSPVDTALREAREEISIDPAKVQILGAVLPVVAIDSSLVFPIVGSVMRDEFEPELNQNEVQMIHEVSAEKLTRSNGRSFSFNMFGCWRDSFLFDCGEISVWGLSAEIVAKANF